VLSAERHAKKYAKTKFQLLLRQSTVGGGAKFKAKKATQMQFAIYELVGGCGCLRLLLPLPLLLILNSR